VLGHRLLTAGLNFWLILTFAFLCLYRLPGDPARMILGQHASAESVAEFRRQAGLDLPLLDQYARYLWRLAHLDLGDSLALHRPVFEIVSERAGTSLKLALAAAFIVVSGGVLFPLLLRSVGDRRILPLFERGLQFTAFAPPYVLATTALLILGGWFGWVAVVFEPSRLGAWLLPAAVLSAYPMALVLHIFVGQLDAQLSSPYARRARAYGFSRTHTLWLEVLPNALPATLAAIVNSLAFFVTSAFFVETVFGVPGLGRLAQEALRQKDIALLAGICLAFCSCVLPASFALDLIQQWLSPRARILKDAS